MFRRKFLTAALVAAVAALSSAGEASAAFKLTLNPGAGNELVVNDDYLGSLTPDSNDKNPFESSITFIGLYDGLKVTSVSGSSNPPGTPEADITTTNLIVENKTGGTKTLTIVFEETAFSIPGPGEVAYVQGKVDQFTFNSGGLTGQVNGSFRAELIDGATTYSTNTVAFSPSSPNELYTTEISPLRSAPNYTMRSVVMLTLDNQSSVTFSTQVISDGDPSNIDPTPIPTPAGLILVATAVPFFGVLRRRMKTVPTT